MFKNSVIPCSDSKIFQSGLTIKTKFLLKISESLEG